MITVTRGFYRQVVGVPLLIQTDFRISTEDVE
jgi:hypothetical protein